MCKLGLEYSGSVSLYIEETEDAIGHFFTDSRCLVVSCETQVIFTTAPGRIPFGENDSDFFQLTVRTMAGLQKGEEAFGKIIVLIKQFAVVAPN